MDSLTPEQRSENMRRIRSADTAPEMTVRRAAHALGYRFRLHVKYLPGRPDLVFPRLGKVIFVHGCFWHCHARCKQFRIPGTRREFWETKLHGNKLRDQAHLKAIRKLGWQALVIWECQTEKPGLSERLQKFLA